MADCLNGDDEGGALGPALPVGAGAAKAQQLRRKRLKDSYSLLVMHELDADHKLHMRSGPGLVAESRLLPRNHRNGVVRFGRGRECGVLRIVTDAMRAKCLAIFTCEYHCAWINGATGNNIVPPHLSDDSDSVLKDTSYMNKLIAYARTITPDKHRLTRIGWGELPPHVWEVPLAARFKRIVAKKRCAADTHTRTTASHACGPTISSRTRFEPSARFVAPTTQHLSPFGPD